MSASIIDGLTQEVNRLVGFGKTEEEIVSSMALKHASLELETVRVAVKAILNNHPNYPLIKTIMRSDLISDISGKKIFIVDRISRRIQEITLSNLEMIFNRKFAIRDRIRQCFFEYDPFSMQQLIKNPHGPSTFNTYSPPAWQEDAFYDGDVIEKVDEIPELYKKFILHLVDNDEPSYNYILDWIAHAIQDRNYCILTTIGYQGIGKGVLGDVMRLLVGDSNYSKTGNRLLEGKFNSQLKNKRIVYCDEVSIKTSREEEKLKDLINSMVEVELKGRDAELTKNFASFYFSSNSIDAIKLYADDRRFSIVNLTSRKLTEVLNKDEIEELLNPENIGEFGRYLYYREVDPSKMLQVFRSARTEEVRSASLAMWHDWFLDEYAVDHKGKTIKLQDVGDAVEDKFGSKVRPGRPAFMDLQSRFPNKYKVLRKVIDGKQVWCIQFAE